MRCRFGASDAVVEGQKETTEGEQQHDAERAHQQQRSSQTTQDDKERSIGLDQALPVALKASELSNRDPGILDTLAEVYFAMGDFDNAIKIGKEALESDPEDQYFKDQVKKYEDAKSEADSQAAR